MPKTDRQLILSEIAAHDGNVFPVEPLRLRVTFDVVAGEISFEWMSDDGAVVSRGRLVPSEFINHLAVLDWQLEVAEKPRNDFCTAHGSSIHAMLARIRKIFPLSAEMPELGLFPDTNLGPARAREYFPLLNPPGEDFWKRLGRDVLDFARLLQSNLSADSDAATLGSAALRHLASVRMGVHFDSRKTGTDASLAPISTLLHLRVTFDQIRGMALLEWTRPQDNSLMATGRVRVTGSDQLTWEIDAEGTVEPSISSHHRNSIRSHLGEWLKRFPTNRDNFGGVWIKEGANGKPITEFEAPFGPNDSPYVWIEDNIAAMAKALRIQFSPLGRMMKDIDPLTLTDFERHERRLRRKEQKLAEEEKRRVENMARMAEERKRREQRKSEAARKTSSAKNHPPVPATPLKERPPVPPVPARIEFPDLSVQETAFPLTDLRGYFLRERAALWWVSNQSDDLLCLPHCKITRLDYQLRTALRVLGPLRGRALLSDEVGLGKTIEAGLVLKELLTRGMVKKFLVLTVPSLVDQWAEELNDKFGLTTVTTNDEAARNNPQTFWRENAGLVASLHTLKQPAHLEIARQTHWDMLIVDEAHYLRNRESLAWQAVNALPRQFLLLLTATPVQNSLEELYNLVTLLQPGQLPSPKEFRARFVDPKRPRQPREPEELRRLLGQVMIRNTRANAGLKLPPRRAETVLFEPDEAERLFWQEWETEFRARLSQLSASQASLWGRLLLQTAGSSPAAWRQALEKFPDREAAKLWREQAPLEASWKRKCDLLAPLAKGEGGVVIFTQFLETQAALAEFLRGTGTETFVINGATPPPERQPITEQFHKRGGALLLTHSGTEGRNLQFCHRLANFDLPWNPMEIEQRIGRLHRLGQKHPVRIYNFVQAGTLQEHLLEVLQEKLNLFELVVGETGLILGEKFSTDEFADEVLRRWRDSEGRVAEAFASLGEELAAARDAYAEVKQLDETLFAKDYESL